MMSAYFTEVNKTMDKRKSVTIRVVGGLGNQLFCYAAARRLAIANGMDLYVDAVSGFAFDYAYHRTYLLDRFSIEASVASARKCFSFPSGRLCRLVLRRCSRWLPRNRRFFFEDRPYSQFEKWFMDVRPKGSVWVEGFFQSPKYFEDIEKNIRNEFRISRTVGATTRRERVLIEKEEEPVMLGVRLYQEARRRGVHLVLSREYYLRAEQALRPRLRNPHYFIFCNDRNWVTEHLRWPYPHTVIEPKPGNEEAYQDLWLMTACKHFIIPNSTFHWWGAWLAEGEKKVVVAPGRGFYNQDTVPATWLKVDV
jgi:hypothetical protein